MDDSGIHPTDSGESGLAPELCALLWLPERERERAVDWILSQLWPRRSAVGLETDIDGVLFAVVGSGTYLHDSLSRACYGVPVDETRTTPAALRPRPVLTREVAGYLTRWRHGPIDLPFTPGEVHELRRRLGHVKRRKKTPKPSFIRPTRRTSKSARPGRRKGFTAEELADIRRAVNRSRRRGWTWEHGGAITPEPIRKVGRVKAIRRYWRRPGTGVLHPHFLALKAAEAEYPKLLRARLRALRRRK